MQNKNLKNYKIIIPIFLLLYILPLTNSFPIFAEEVKVNIIEFNDSNNIPLNYTIHIQYPQVEGLSSPLIIDTINNTIKTYWQNTVDSFKNKFANMDLLKLGKNKPAWCEMHFQVFSTKDIFSFSFFIYKLYTDLNIPIATVKSFNFDLTTGVQLSLDDLFQSNSDYLTALSSNAREDLKAEIDEDPDEATYDYNSVIEGTTPMAENFQYFNISPSSLIIIFEPYHFGTKSDRFVQAEIPWDKIKSVMKR